MPSLICFDNTDECLFLPRQSNHFTVQCLSVFLSAGSYSEKFLSDVLLASFIYQVGTLFRKIRPRRNEMQFFNHSSHHFQSEIFYLIQSWKGGRLHAAPLLDWLTHKIFFRR